MSVSYLYWLCAEGREYEWGSSGWALPAALSQKGNGDQPSSKVSKLLKPKTNGISILEVGDLPCVFRDGPENER